jgi:protein O-mannosyl-transferase
MFQRRRQLALGVVLVLVTAWVFAPVRAHDFVDHDDRSYVVENEHLLERLDFGWLVHNLTEVHHAHWIPLTWLSYRIDAALFGIDAAAMLTVNVVLHVLTSLLLAITIRWATGSWLMGWIVAFWFALHPQRVESVAWVSARRDVLGALFGVLAVLVHVKRVHTSTPGPVHDVVLALLFALALLASPLLVSLPFCLLLLDTWPLRRVSSQHGLRDLGRLVVEKLPLFGLAGASALIAWRTRQLLTGPTETDVGALASMIGHALVLVAQSLSDAVWPVALSPFHAQPAHGSPLMMTAASALVLLAVTVLALRQRRRRPWLTIGWAWTLVTLLPAIAGLDLGAHARADRWMSLPSIGLAIMVAGCLGEVRRARPSLRVPAFAFAVAVGILLTMVTRAQVHHWRDTETLFAHALHLDADNWYAHLRVAQVRAAQERLEEAEQHYLATLTQVPGYARAQFELADVLQDLGRREAADALRANAQQTGPHDPFADGRLGTVLVRMEREDLAVALLERALARDARSGDLHAALAVAHARSLDVSAARAHVDQALRVAPRTADGLILLAWLLATAPEAELRDPEMARRALAEFDPREPHPRPEQLDALAATHAALGDFRSASAFARRAADAALGREYYDLADRIEDRVLLYLQQEPYYEKRRSRFEE